MESHQIKKYIKKTILEGKHKMNTSIITEFDLGKILPGVEKIHEDNRSVLVYGGNECYVDILQLYKYKSYYVVFIASSEKCDYTKCNDYVEVYGGLSEALDETIEVISTTNFDEREYLDLIDDIKSIELYFKRMHPVCGKMYCMRYIANRIK
jgi:hypothetical protein